MSKIYKVRLFDGKIVNGQKDYEYVGNIIVKKNQSGVTELLTGYRVSVFQPGCIKVDKVNEKVIKKYGHQPFISQEDLVQKNLATPQDIEEYVDGYETSKWKSIYDEMKFFTIAEKVVINARVKELYKSKNPRKKR